MPSSVLTFANSNDALWCLSEHVNYLCFAPLPPNKTYMSQTSEIQSQRLLYNLCLVNWRFNTEFSTSLYRHVRISSNAALEGVCGSVHLTHCKRLTIVQHWGSEEQTNELVQNLLPKMPSLEAFKWNGALATHTIHILRHSCRKIKSLQVEYPEEIQSRLLGLSIVPEDDKDDEYSQKARGIFRDQNFSALTDLEELTIDNIYDDLYRWRMHLVKILRNSPRLRKLGLSISVETLCYEYGGSRASPLQLQSLKCGTDIWPMSAAALQKLTDPSYLEELHIDNESVQGDSIYLYLYEDDESGIVFDTFLSPACPNLRRFTVNKLQGDVCEALCSNTDASWTRQLAISFECLSESDYEMAQILTKDPKYPGLPMKLRMMDLDLGYSNEDETKETLDNLVSSNLETLEGLAVHLPQNQNGEIGHLDLLQNTILKMLKVTQIAINIHKSIYGRSNVAERVHKAAAEKLANAASHLQFINICWSFWRIWRPIDAEGKLIMILELMDEWEREDVELFQHTIFDAS